jgi:transitional endoplasmic reticulum ATPase
VEIQAGTNVAYSPVRIVVEPADEISDTLHLGFRMWDVLGVRVGEALSVTPIVVGPAREATLTFHHPKDHHGFQDELRAQLLLEQPILWRGKEQAVRLPGSIQAHHVHVEHVDPAPSMVTAETALRLIDHGHDHHHGPVGSSGAVSNVATGQPTDIGGLDVDYVALRSAVMRSLRHSDLHDALGVRPTKGALLYGPPGCGKTLLARVLGRDVGANVLIASGTDLIGKYSGETEASLRDLFRSAAQSAPCLVVIDEIDVLAVKRQRLGAMGDVRVCTQLLALMDGVHAAPGVFVLGTTNRIEVIDDAFRRPGRFDLEYHVAPPATARQRLEVLDVHTRTMPMTQAAIDELAAGVEGLRGASGADLMQVARRIGLAALERHIANHTGSEEVSVDVADVRVGILSFESSLVRAPASTLYRPPISWADLEDVDDVKELLISFARSVVTREPGAEGILLTGPPGAGKTSLARALAGELGMALVELDASSIFNQWLGESEGELRKAFERARDLSPAVLILDRIEVLAPAASNVGATSTADLRVLACLLAELDASLAAGGIVVIGTTDRPQLIDWSLLRAGRFGQVFDLPSRISA